MLLKMKVLQLKQVKHLIYPWIDLLMNFIYYRSMQNSHRNLKISRIFVKNVMELASEGYSISENHSKPVFHGLYDVCHLDGRYRPRHSATEIKVQI